MESGFGLLHLWAQGDAVTRLVALVLLAMSLASWVVILLKAMALRRRMAQARCTEAFWNAADYAAAVEALGGEADNPFRGLALAGHAASARSGTQPTLEQGLNRSDWVTRHLRHAVDEALARLQSGLAVLASVGSTAPFVGLFGTVWGIYHALMSISGAGQATIDRVAGPVGEALVMTALGLAVAIPAVLAYNALVRGNKRVVMKLNRFAHDLHAYLLTGERLQAGTPAQRA